MALPQRVLIDWDFGAHGIWKILSTEELSAPPAPGGKWAPFERAMDAPRPWSDRLSIDLLDALQEWNDAGEAILGRGKPTTGPDLDAFWTRAAELAEGTQQELGPGYEVLHVIPGGAWQWVQPPSQRWHLPS